MSQARGMSIAVRFHCRSVNPGSLGVAARVIEIVRLRELHLGLAAQLRRQNRGVEFGSIGEHADVADPAQIARRRPAAQ
jgi:hypothetical protein